MHLDPAWKSTKWETEATTIKIQSPCFPHYIIEPFLLLLLLSCFSRVRLCVTPQTAAHQAPLPLGSSRQEHCSGLPFPSPMHESERWKWSHSVMSNLVTPWTAAYQVPPFMEFSRQEYWSGVPLPSPFFAARSYIWVPGFLLKKTWSKWNTHISEEYT